MLLGPFAQFLGGRCYIRGYAVLCSDAVMSDAQLSLASSGLVHFLKHQHISHGDGTRNRKNRRKLRVNNRVVAALVWFMCFFFVPFGHGPISFIL